jgi:hypothetical protein
MGNILKRILFSVLVIFAVVQPSGSLIKQSYGGNIRIADLLAERLDAYELWRGTEMLQPVFSLPSQISETSATLDLTSLNPEWMAEIEQSVLALQNPENGCHWILDYPYFNHSHPNNVTVESGKLTVTSMEPDYLQVILTSTCVNPKGIEALRPFRATQFGYEASITCAGGRPFLDSITPAPVDPSNPYLAFKLKDVDIIPIPEERFLQVLGDPELQIIPGARYFVYLLTSGFTQEEAAAFAQAAPVREAARTVLNDHAEILIGEKGFLPVQKRRVHYILPQDEPYRLLAERMIVGWQENGYEQAASADPAIPAVIVGVERVDENHEDAFKYLLLLDLMKSGDRPWFEIWEEMEASGKLIPLLMHQSMIAARSNIIDLRVRPNGILDLASAWIRTQP